MQLVPKSYAAEHDAGHSYDPSKPVEGGCEPPTGIARVLDIPVERIEFVIGCLYVRTELVQLAARPFGVRVERTEHIVKLSRRR